METSETTLGASTITAWTLIVRARGSGPEASRALGELLQKFRPFIIWCLGALRPPPDTNPDDLFQEFAVGFIRRKEVGTLKRYGSLRGWLKAALRNFLYNEWDSYKRRQRLVHVAVERSASVTETEIDGAYLGTVVMQALELARSRTPDPERFEKLARFLPGPQSDFVPYEEVAVSLGISEGAARAAVHKERDRYQKCLDEVLLPTLDVGDDADNPERVKQLLETEKRALLRALDPPPEVVSLDGEREPP
jgi:DNA-directed RNA polymerase specialized sigma24 family protein